MYQCTKPYIDDHSQVLHQLRLSPEDGVQGLWKRSQLTDI